MFSLVFVIALIYFLTIFESFNFEKKNLINCIVISPVLLGTTLYFLPSYLWSTQVLLFLLFLFLSLFISFSKKETNTLLLGILFTSQIFIYFEILPFLYMWPLLALIILNMTSDIEKCFSTFVAFLLVLLFSYLIETIPTFIGAKLISSFKLLTVFLMVYLFELLLSESNEDSSILLSFFAFIFTSRVFKYLEISAVPAIFILFIYIALKYVYYSKKQYERKDSTQFSFILFVLLTGLSITNFASIGFLLTILIFHYLLRFGAHIPKDLFPITVLLTLLLALYQVQESVLLDFNNIRLMTLGFSAIILVFIAIQKIVELKQGYLKSQ